MKILCAALLLIGAACGGGKPIPTQSREVPAPAWLSQGSGAFGGDAGRRFQGVGSASSPDPKERRKSADAQARSQLDQAMTAFLGKLTSMSESTRNDLGQTVSAIGKKTLASSRVLDHWVAKDGSEQAVAVLDLETFESTVRESDGDGKIKVEMASNAGRAFDTLAKQ